MPKGVKTDVSHLEQNALIRVQRRKKFGILQLAQYAKQNAKIRIFRENRIFRETGNPETQKTGL